MSVPDIDLNARAQRRVAGLLKASTRFRAYVGAISAGFTLVKEALQSVDEVYDIDKQSGVNLDVIGRIVGQPRRLLGAALRSYFGFRIDEPGDFQRALPAGDRADTGKGGPMWGREKALTGSALMDDAVYRFAIRARIVKNNLRPDGESSWIDRIYAVLLLIFTDANSTDPGGVVTHNYPLWVYAGGRTITVCVGKIPSSREVALLTQADLLPIPGTFGTRCTCWDNTKDVFGFEGQQASSCYGDRRYPTRGGVFAERVSQNVSS